MQMKLIENDKSMDSSVNLVDLDDLIIKRKGGGSIIDHRALFSSDGEILYIVWKNVIRAYSTQTGDFVREFEPSDYKIVSVTVHPDNNNVIIGCTERGELNFWNCQSSIITKKLQLNFPEKDKIKINTFHIVKYRTPLQSEICQGLVTYLSNCGYKIFVVLFDIENGTYAKLVHIYIQSQEYFIDVIGNHGDNLIALLQDTNLYILNPARNLIYKLHKTGKTGRLPTCIAGHPEEECVATGDSTGRVVVWRNLFQNRPYTASFHWHTLPVTEIAFSKSGGHMYTGGGECVLVKWTLAHTHRKSFLPRLPAPIKHLTIAPENLYVAVSTLDNGIAIVTPQRKVTSVIQNFTWGVASSSKDLFPAGLVADPRTGSLVLNSRTGHVQFYNTQTKNLLYIMNITAQNFLTHERDVMIVNTEVTKIALNHDGTWMATIEERNDKVSSIEVRLKFWIFDLNKQIFALNTSFELPHENGVNALQFQPVTTFDDEECLAVTTGKDKKFKIWNLNKFSVAEEETKHWCCYGVGNYRNLSVTDAGFSMDGSLLAIGFHSTLTVWIPETFELKSSLTHIEYNQPITRVEFGKHEACHLVVIASQQYIVVWNILTLTITWTVYLNVVSLTYDPKSTYMAAFTSDNSLYVFTPQSSTLVYKKPYLLESTNSILGAVFVPHLQEKRNPSFGKWQRKSQLYFLDSNRELLTLEPESEAGVSLEMLLNKEKTTPLTAFANFIATQSPLDKEQTVAQVHENLTTSTKGMVQELLSMSAHTLPPIRLLCTPFILSLTNQQLTNRSKTTDGSRDSDDDIQDNIFDLSDNEASRPMKHTVMPINENKDTDESIVELINHDWSFLSTIFPDQGKAND